MNKIEITKVVEIPQYLKMLVYGGPGVGKTVFSSTAPNVLFCDAEAGVLSIANKDIDMVKITNFSQTISIYEFLLADNHKYEAVVLDSLTEIQLKSMDVVLKYEYSKNPNRDPDIPTLKDWGKSTEQIRKMVRAFRDLPMHVIFVCLSTDVKDELTGALYTKPALPGKLSDRVCGYVDIIGYLDIRKDTDGKPIRKMLFQPYSNVVAKDRSGKLPLVMENPTFPKILKIIKKRGK